jgi:hypothetical protein
MTQQQRTLTQATADRVTGKLQTFYDQLPDDEREVVELLLRQAAANGQDRGYNVGEILQVGPIAGATRSNTGRGMNELITIPLVFP